MRYLSFLLLVVIYSCHKEQPCQAPALYGDNSLWYALIGSDSTTPNFPDYYANYYIYNCDRTQLEGMGLRIDGTFGDARYMSYNVYDFETGVGVATLIDKDIMPAECSDNPFAPTNPEATSKNYSIYIVPESQAAALQGVANLLVFPDSIDTLSIFFRYYAPRPDNNAGAPLPYISAYDFAQKKPLATPTQLASNFEENIDELVAQVQSFLQVQIDSVMRFYNVDAAGMFTNLDANYLATPITVAPDEVYMLRFKAPSFNASNADVRYWSLNMGDGQTHIRQALKDEDAIIAADGFVTVVVAKDTPANRNKAQGLNFMPLPIAEGEDMGLIYRNLVTNPGFVGDIDNVPVLDTTPINVLLLDAKQFIGDYAPRGLRMSTADYLLDFGGFPVSY